MFCVFMRFVVARAVFCLCLLLSFDVCVIVCLCCLFGGWGVLSCFRSFDCYCVLVLFCVVLFVMYCVRACCVLFLLLYMLVRVLNVFVLLLFCDWCDVVLVVQLVC